MTLRLFGGERPWESLLDDRPILSGRHPLHLYHGYLGARALHEHGNLSCYDPTFHAGYPKTPIFDSGSRPAELILAVAGGRYYPAAYKVGVALVCILAPLLLFAAARSVGLGRAAACLACALGLLVWWGQPCRDALESGEVDLLLATLLVLAQAGLLIRYHNDPGLLSWLGVVAAALLGWFAHPLLLVLLLPLFLVYYLSVGTRHRLAWHLALLSGLLAAIAVNGFWLIDWVGYWWIRVPTHLDAPLLAHHTLRSVWEAPLWGGPIDKALACALAAAAAAGVLLYNETSQRATARLLGLAWGSFLLLSVIGLTWEPLGRWGAHHLLVPALLFAALPAGHALSTAVRLIGRWRGTRWAGLAAGALVAVLLGLSPPPALAEWATRLLGTPPLQLGLDENQQALLEILRSHTTPDARILWEDRRGTPSDAHWTALLPLLTERAYVGGLDPEAGIEHTANGLTDQVLLGRPLAEWKEDRAGRLLRALQHRLGRVLVARNARALSAVEQGRMDGDTTPVPHRGAARLSLRAPSHARFRSRRFGPLARRRLPTHRLGRRRAVARRCRYAQGSSHAQPPLPGRHEGRSQPCPPRKRSPRTRRTALRLHPLRPPVGRGTRDAHHHHLGQALTPPRSQRFTSIPLRTFWASSTMVVRRFMAPRWRRRKASASVQR